MVPPSQYTTDGLLALQILGFLQRDGVSLRWNHRRFHKINQSRQATSCHFKVIQCVIELRFTAEFATCLQLHEVTQLQVNSSKKKTYRVSVTNTKVTGAMLTKHTY